MSHHEPMRLVLTGARHANEAVDRSPPHPRYLERVGIAGGNMWI